MKNKFISTSSKSKLCLISFILLCCVFTSKNAYSLKWNRNDLNMAYIQKENAIYINFQFYQYPSDLPYSQSFFKKCTLLYSEDGLTFTPLVKCMTIKQQESKDKKWIMVIDKKPNETITYPGSNIKQGESISKLWFNMMEKGYRDAKGYKMITYFDFNIKWTLPKSIKSIEAIKLQGDWDDPNNKVSISETYPIKGKSSVMSNVVKVNVNAGEIIVSGVNPDQIIKLYYATTGLEVKSVVAKDDVVNIKLPTNQTYIVKVGEFSQQVSL